MIFVRVVARFEKASENEARLGFLNALFATRLLEKRFGEFDGKLDGAAIRFFCGAFDRLSLLEDFLKQGLRSRFLLCRCALHPLSV
jgi:hypothetical protein